MLEDDETRMHKALVPLASTVVSAAAEVQTLVIDSDAAMIRAQEGLKTLKAVVKQIKEAQATWVEPAKATIDSAKARFGPALELAAQLEETVKQKCIDYRAQANARQAQRLIEAQQVINAQAPMQEQRAAIAAIPLQLPKVSNVSFVDTKEAIITDEKLLPEKYWIVTRSPNTWLIADDSAKGIAIPGVEMMTRTTMRAGSK